MEEKDVKRRTLLKRLAPRALAVAILGGLIGLGSSGPPAAIGAISGGLGAGFYAWSYLRSHLSRMDRDRFFDRGLAGSAVIRMLLMALLGFALYAVGRVALLAFLLSFAVAFLVLVSSEIPKVTQILRARGVIGGR